MHEKVLETTQVFAGRLLRLRVDRVVLPSGRRMEREVVEHPGAVAILPVLQGQRLVMIRQFREAIGEALLEIPAGTLEPGEAPMHCARRELAEETGYTPERLTELFSCYLAPGYSTEKIRFFLAERLRPRPRRPAMDERIKVLRIRLPDAVRLIESGKIRDAKTICGIYHLNRHLRDEVW